MQLSLDPRKVVVTGGAGFVGSWLCERLLDFGCAVLCVDNFATGLLANVAHLMDHPAFTLLEADVCDGVPVEGPLDWVLHLASPASPAHYLEQPIATLRVGSLGTMRALELAESKRARFLMASTSEVYGDPLENPQRESYWGHVNPVGPRSVYDEAKRFSEAVAAAFRRDRGVDTAIARIFNTYGPRMRLDDGRAVPTFMTQALRGQPITVAGDGSQTRSLCFVEDTVDGLLALAASGHPGPMNIGNPDEMTMLDLAGRIRELAGSPSPVEFIGLPQDDPKVRCPDITLAQEVLGWAPEVSAEEGLKRTLAWWSEQRL